MKQNITKKCFQCGKNKTIKEFGYLYVTSKKTGIRTQNVASTCIACRKLYTTLAIPILGDQYIKELLTNRKLPHLKEVIEIYRLKIILHRLKTGNYPMETNQLAKEVTENMNKMFDKPPSGEEADISYNDIQRSLALAIKKTLEGDLDNQTLNAISNATQSYLNTVKTKYQIIKEMTSSKNLLLKENEDGEQHIQKNSAVE